MFIIILYYVKGIVVSKAKTMNIFYTGLSENIFEVNIVGRGNWNHYLRIKNNSPKKLRN